MVMLIDVNTADGKISRMVLSDINDTHYTGYSRWKGLRYGKTDSDWYQRQ